MRRIFSSCFFHAGIVYLLLVTAAAMPAWSQGPPNFHNRIVLIVEEGETVMFVPQPTPTGSSAPLSLVNVGPVGSYVTAMDSSTAEEVLVDLLTNGTATAGPFEAVFTLPTGEILEEHTAWFTLSPEQPKFAATFGIPEEDIAVVVVTAEGTITGGTGQFTGATGVSRIYLKFELPIGIPVFPIARTSPFVFEFD